MQSNPRDGAVIINVGHGVVVFDQAGKHYYDAPKEGILADFILIAAGEQIADGKVGRSGAVYQSKMRITGRVEAIVGSPANNQSSLAGVVCSGYNDSVGAGGTQIVKLVR